MTDDATPADLAPIAFESPGRFTLHNPQAPSGPAATWEPAPFVLGGEPALQRFSLPEQARSHTLAMMRQARRTLCIHSPDLEPWLYHHGSIEQACTDFLLRHRSTRLRILVRDSSRAVREGHRLIALSRKLPSHLHIRRCHPDYSAPESAYLLADDLGLLMLAPDQAAGYASYQDRSHVRQLQRQFDHAWDTSLLDPDLRTFLL